MIYRFLINMNLLIRSSKRINYLILFILLFISGCKKSSTPAISSSKKFIQLNQGIKGKVLFKEGKFYPNGEIDGNGKVYGVPREILIYERTNIKEVDLAEYDFVKSVNTNIIARDFSNDKGEFKIFLEPGSYSVFIKENERLYSKLLYDERTFFPIEVKNDLFTEVIIEVDYLANY